MVDFFRPRDHRGSERTADQLKGETAIIRKLGRSEEFHKLQSSFEKAFEMPLAICSPEEQQPVMHGRARENNFCRMLFARSETCEACILHQRRIHDEARETASTCTRTCPHGMVDAAVPIAKDGRVIGYLRTGQVFENHPTKADFAETMELLMEESDDIAPDEIYEAFFQTRVVGHDKMSGILGLLEIYAERLSRLAGELELATDSLEPGIIKRTREYIRNNLDQPLSLESVSRVVHCNSFYLCKLFKKVTGSSFTEYINQMRLKRAKELLVNQDLRISEVAMDSGFQSITHFNRVFRRVVGCSPTDYRRNHEAVRMTAVSQ